MSWLYLLIAGLLEVLGVIWLNQFARSKQKIYIILMAVTFIFSFSTLKLAMAPFQWELLTLSGQVLVLLEALL